MLSKKNIYMTLQTCAIALFLFSKIAWGQGADSPPDTINSLDISMRAAKHYLKYTHFQIIGVCFWLEHGFMGFPKISVSSSIEEYLPDLVVSVYNEPGDNPWIEARTLLDETAHSVGQLAIQSATGHTLTGGRNNSVQLRLHSDSDVTKFVDVIGNPLGLIDFPFVSLRYDAKPFMPYYQSALDALPSRMGFAEAIRPETWNPFSHYIGQGFSNHWGYEFPREMTTTNDNDFKASFVLAQRAADIVTNRNTLHVVKSTSNSCGTHCSVANVIEEQKDDHEKWQEIYPIDRHIRQGESDATSMTPIGQKDAIAGHGNYVFMVWRRYKGCVQHPGKLIFATPHVSTPHKR